MIANYKKKLIYFYVFLSVLVFVVPLLPYVYKFPDLANETKDFANFGSYFGGVLSPVFTFLTFVILILSLIYQQKGIAQASIDNKNNLLLPKTFEALEFSYKELFEFLDNHANGVQVCLTSGQSEASPNVSIYRLFYEPHQIPDYLKSAPKFGPGTISRNIDLCINQFERIAKIEDSIVTMQVPYFCIERQVREVYSRYKCMMKLLREHADETQSRLLENLDVKYMKIESRLKMLEPAEIKRSFNYS